MFMSVTSGGSDTYAISSFTFSQNSIPSGASVVGGALSIVPYGGAQSSSSDPWIQILSCECVDGQEEGISRPVPLSL